MNVNASYCFQEDDFYYGIYRSAVNLTTQDRVVTRYMYSLFWGFQVISFELSYSFTLLTSHGESLCMHSDFFIS